MIMPTPIAKQHSDKGLSSILVCPKCHERIYYCPIPGCTKQFRMGRAGWDSHVTSFRLHPNWLPDIKDGDKRKSKFRKDFLEWFKN